MAGSFFDVTHSTIEACFDTDPYYLREMDDNSTFSPGYAYWVYLETDQFWYAYSH
ncbi:MAG: hypothetical protein V3U09_05125 [Thermoplasmata archaeon]